MSHECKYCHCQDKEIVTCHVTRIASVLGTVDQEQWYCRACRNNWMVNKHPTDQALQVLPPFKREEADEILQPKKEKPPENHYIVEKMHKTAILLGGG